MAQRSAFRVPRSVFRVCLLYAVMFVGQAVVGERRIAAAQTYVSGKKIRCLNYKRREEENKSVQKQTLR